VSTHARGTRDLSTTLRTFVDVAHRQILSAEEGRLLSIRLTLSSIDFNVPVLPELPEPRLRASESLASRNMRLPKTLPHSANLHFPGAIPYDVRTYVVNVCFPI
jgi:hypothetical protein